MKTKKVVNKSTSLRKTTKKKQNAGGSRFRDFIKKLKYRTTPTPRTPTTPTTPTTLSPVSEPSKKSKTVSWINGRNNGKILDGSTTDRTITIDTTKNFDFNIYQKIYKQLIENRQKYLEFLNKEEDNLNFILRIETELKVRGDKGDEITQKLKDDKLEKEEKNKSYHNKDGIYDIIKKEYDQLLLDLNSQIPNDEITTKIAPLKAQFEDLEIKIPEIIQNIKYIQNIPINDTVLPTSTYFQEHFNNSKYRKLSKYFTSPINNIKREKEKVLSEVEQIYQKMIKNISETLNIYKKNYKNSEITEMIVKINRETNTSNKETANLLRELISYNEKKKQEYSKGLAKINNLERELSLLRNSLEEYNQNINQDLLKKIKDNEQLIALQRRFSDLENEIREITKNKPKLSVSTDNDVPLLQA